ncbi:hypothetical protein CEV31_0573 [Brucella thiophenivorans]|uniref:Uncharacterized protein n=1 Tax=Brucella thiophenivorans TaxID=571255 RepID=A0A256G3Q6_9HYPH|nr:hypothetical protein CEV31_0573 [Brucella thiophenivorans]
MTILSTFCENNFTFTISRFSEIIFLVSYPINGNYRHQGGLEQKDRLKTIAF